MRIIWKAFKKTQCSGFTLDLLLNQKSVVWDPGISNFESFLSDSSVQLPELRRNRRKVRINSQNVVPGPPASASPRKLSEMHILPRCPRTV